jgi:hypothetical protein
MFNSTAELSTVAEKIYGVFQIVGTLAGYGYCVRIIFHYVLILCFLAITRSS